MLNQKQRRLLTEEGAGFLAKARNPPKIRPALFEWLIRINLPLLSWRFQAAHPWSSSQPQVK